MSYLQNKKLRKVLRTIIIITLTFVIASFVATKVIYDSTFPRYDSKTEVKVSTETSLLKKERSAYSFKCGDNTLKGYLYEKENTETLVVIVPGYRSSSDNYLEQIRSFLNNQNSVFIFDTTGSGESEGDSAIGFSQALLDLNSALSFIRKNDNFGFESIVLFGHSRGGYAACCALEYNNDISAVISVAGLNSAMEAVILPATEYIGQLAYFNYPFLWSYQSMLFGSEITSLSAVQSIKNSDVPIFIIHGTDDDIVSLDKGSIIAHKDEINSKNVEYFISEKKGQNGHTDILFDISGGANKELFDRIDVFLEKSIKG